MAVFDDHERNGLIPGSPNTRLITSYKSTSGGSVKPDGDFFDLEGGRVARYVWVSQFVSAKAILDAGCGYGYGSAFLAERGATKLVGIDSDRAAIEFASLHYKRDNLEFSLMDVHHMTLPPESFDVVVSFELIEHLSEPVSYLESISKVLKSRGLFIISTPNKKFTKLGYIASRSPNPLHLKEYYPDELSQLLARFVPVRRVFREDFPEDVLSRERAVQQYLGETLIPSFVGRIVPSVIRSAWLRLMGIPPIVSTRGRWREFGISEVDDVESLTEAVPVMIFLCEKS